MRKSEGWKSIRNVVQIVAIAVFCAATVALEFLCCVDGIDTLQKTMLCKILQQACGGVAAILLMVRLSIRLFGKTQKWLYLLPCMLVAINNFPFSAFFNGKMQLIYTNPMDVFLFGLYCLLVGLFEECIFRGVIFGVLAAAFPQNKKGFLLTYFISSVLFGLVHILNGLSVGTLLQIGYSILTGGLFAFCLIKTKNVLCCALVHGVYNFCGLLFGAYDPAQGIIGLGSGVVFDVGSIVTMLIVGVLVGVFVLYKVFTYSNEEHAKLYQKLGINAEKE